MELTNSKRVLRSASYALPELTREEERQMEGRDGRALEKLNFIRQTAIQPEDVANAREQMALETDVPEERLREVFATLSRVVTALTSGTVRNVTNVSLAPLAATIPATYLIAAALETGKRVGATAVNRLAIEAFRQRMRRAPVGRLHLERLEIYPAGVERGELMFTVPLAPKETITISHKEWSTSGEEYERIVQDYFETYSERGVAEKTDAAMSVENESKRAAAFNFSAVGSGSYGPVSMTVMSGINLGAEDRQALKESAQRSREVTEKASARTRQEHKVSAKLEAKRGAEDSSFRTITNPHTDHALRIDYYRMMRKWRTDLFRYDLRLTFDIAIPIPGARLWALYRRVRELDAEIGKPFVFPLKPADLTDQNWLGYGAEPPPDPQVTLVLQRVMEAGKMGEPVFEFVAPAGYEVAPEVKGVITYWGPAGQPSLTFSDHAPNLTAHPAGAGHGTIDVKAKAISGSERCALTLVRNQEYWLSVVFQTVAMRREDAFGAWRLKSWTALRDAAFATRQAEVAQLQAERDQLWMQLAGKDTLTLRRLEREELIRDTLYWLIGVDFDPTPGGVGKVFEKLVSLEQNQLPDDWPGADLFRRLSDGEWAKAAGFGDFVKFIHHAVEWENLLYFLYPYFWGSDDLARERMLFEHPDPGHRDFLRAGYARVVVPVRRGFEAAFTELLDTGVFSGPDSSLYLSMAEEIANFARTNYAGVPPANPEKHARPLLFPQQRKTWATMQAVVLKLEAYAQSHQEAYPADLSVLPGAPFKDAWGRDLVYRNPGSGNDYDLLSLGADGVAGGEGLDADISAGAAASLMASWFDYTPTSGIDIELTAVPQIVV